MPGWGMWAPRVVGPEEWCGVLCDVIGGAAVEDTIRRHVAQVKEAQVQMKAQVVAEQTVWDTANNKVEARESGSLSE